jgi:hypothetical protein
VSAAFDAEYAASVPGARRAPAALRDPGVVHEDVDPAELVVGAAGERLDGVEIGQIDDPRAGLRRMLAQALEHVTQTILAARADADDRAPFRESLGERGADPGGCSGDQHLLAVK